MSSAAVAERRRLWPGPDQLVLRSMFVLGVLVGLLAAEGAGARPSGLVSVTVTALAVVTALRPESVAAIVSLGGVAYTWCITTDPLSPLVLLAAAGMVLAHLSALVAAQGPALLRVDGRQVWHWLRRGVLLWAASAAVWGLALLLEDHPGGRTTYAVGLLLLATVALVGTREVSRRVG